MSEWLKTVRFGDVLVMTTFIVSAAVSWNNLNWRIKIIEDWKAAYYHSSAKQDTNISLLRENAAKLTAMMEGQERRLILLEDRPHIPGSYRVGM